MTNLQQSATHFADTKPHYALLDGLRGVAALLVVWYHVFEGYQFASGSAIIREINHGYLAVDFFFILSGFVIGYAYDDRWGKTLTLGKFFRRRLIRLHPMVVMGALIGLVMFILQGAVTWEGTPASVPAMMIALLCGLLMIPALPGCGYEVRGNGEMFPLNGPAWSLFFEYIGNILYALFIRRFSTRALAILAGILSILLLWFTATACLRLRHVWCGLDARWSQLLGWTSAPALPVYDRNAAVPCFPSHPVQGKGSVLDQFHHSSPALPRTLYREYGWRQYCERR